MKKLTLILSLLISFASTVAAWADTEALAVGQMRIQADSAIKYDIDGRTFVAEPHAKITYNDITLTADRIEGYTETGDIHAHGNVVFKSNARNLKGDTFEYNFKTGVGDAKNASAEANGIYFTGVEIRSDDKKYTLLSSRFSGCNAPVPHYYLMAKEIVVEPGKQLVASKVALFLYGRKIVSMPRLKVKLTEPREHKTNVIPPISFTPRNGLQVGREFDLSPDTKTSCTLAVGVSSRHLLEGGLFYEKTPYGPLYARATYRVPVSEGTQAGTLVSRYPEIGLRFAGGKDAERVDTSKRSINLFTGVPSTLAPSQSPGELNHLVEIGYGYFMEEPSTTKGSRFDGRFVAWLNPIVLDSKTAFSPGVMARYSRYGVGQNYTTLGFRGTIGRRLGPRSSLELTYANLQMRGETPFDFDRNELSEELNVKVKFPFAGMQWGLGPRYDLQRGRLYDIEYSVSKLFHCIQPTVTLGNKFHEVKLGVMLVGI